MTPVIQCSVKDTTSAVGPTGGERAKATTGFESHKRHVTEHANNEGVYPEIERDACRHTTTRWAIENLSI